MLIYDNKRAYCILVLLTAWKNKNNNLFGNCALNSAFVYKIPAKLVIMLFW